MWLCKGKTKEEINSIIQKRGIALAFEEKQSGVIFSPTVQFKVDLYDFTVRKLETPHFYRHQTIAFSKKFRKIYDIHSVSEKIAIVDADSYRLKNVIDCGELGISDPRGAVLTEDEKFLIVSGRWNNIYFFDAEKDTFLKEKTLNSCNYFNSHISVSA